MRTKQVFQAAAAIALLASCTATQPLAQRDDVYFMPSSAPVAKRAEPKPQQAPPEAGSPSDDYYDAGTARDLGTSRGFYDMAYNDPYYYNYGRFGFGMGMGMMGWQSGWNGPGWGMGFGWGGDPWMSMGMGWGRPWGWNRPFGWNDPWAWNSPWGWNNPWNSPWGFGNGFGNYWGPMGPCLWYVPVGVTTNSVIGHRPTVGSSSTGSLGGMRQPRMATRNPVGLQPAVVNHRSGEGLRHEPIQQSTIREGRSTGNPRPITFQREGQRQDGGRAIDRAPAPRGGFESRPSIGRGGDSSPSRSGGGGSVPMRRGR